jgi:hypothetical protein
MVNIPICYSNSTIVNVYWHYRKLVYKIIVNRGGYKITYFVASYRVYSLIYIYIYSNSLLYDCIKIVGYSREYGEYPLDPPLHCPFLPEK